MKKIIIATCILCILFVPIRYELKDGGSVVYRAATYNVQRWNCLWPDNNIRVGTTLDILGFNVYDSTHLVQNDIFAKSDYPLIDVPLGDGNNWMIVIKNDLYTENANFKICKDAKSLQQIKEFLCINTFPVGRGTTANGVVEVYKNGILHKSVEFLNFEFSDQALEKEFENVDKEELEVLLNS